MKRSSKPFNPSQGTANEKVHSHQMAAMVDDMETTLNQIPMGTFLTKSFLSNLIPNAELSQIYF